MKNIVLIGMPGSGKTAVGALAAAKLGRELLDTDAMVEASEGMTIPALFSLRGEGYFRDAESAAVRRAASARGAVISTGGGAVLRPENVAALRETGVLCFLDRPPGDIADEEHGGRPLIGGDRENIFALYRQRIGLYRAAADCTVPNRGTAEDAAALLLKVLEGKI
jgi:shikimate kinase